MLRDFFLGILKVHILYQANRSPVFGKGLMQELSRHGYHVSPGTLYPILHGLEREKLLKSYPEKVKGKVRRYYQTTSRGSQALSYAQSKISELVQEILS
ncbi:MAG: PadR family transcriptional regulator [Anaerolineaceae bacterium]|jgi:DNA-binding PadR family transcriptional regulator|nr:MAG: PadR family transcriptional regulator [Chloroflexi bacterium HGW-Chloroflexi-8]